jgi:hypothetical protein
MMEKFDPKDKYTEEQLSTPNNPMRRGLERSCHKSATHKSTQLKRKKPGDHISSRKHLKEMLKITQLKEKREKQMLVP